MELPSLEATRELARQVVIQAAPGTLLILSGPLGAGKTTLTQQLALELGSTAQVSSPTYTLVHEYPTLSGPLVHIDAYRLPDLEALLGLGLEDYLERARLVVVEWGTALLTEFPEAMHIELILSDDTRRALVHRGLAP
ncbi:MAG: tRNA (adenosine(37)-N6)-threonylcarbamoyltransferase complex ATPase subunit type 1 TsaE [Trueperaceae bacterium]|nr:MAG: tRNA (adenosine(37)-N6)-threonylcarbamoyltransferase complex ATPase subunit type 1 TsaE [Trueperaceae bacterium]